MKHEDIFAGILVGGRGRRLGGFDKARLRTPHKKTFVQDMTARITPWVSSIVLAGRSEQAAQYPHAHFVADTHTHAGPLAGLHALLLAAPKPWCWLIAVDMPTLGPELLMALVQARARASPAGAAAPRIIVPHSPAGPEPCAALYHRSLLEAVQSHLSQGIYALRAFIGHSAHVQVPATSQQVRNVNRWHELAAAFDT